MTGLTRDDFHRYRWNGGPVMPSVTTVLKLQDALNGTDHLVRWAARLGAEHAIANAAEPDTAFVVSEAIGATKRAANLGTEVHEQVRRVIAGERVELRPDTAPFIGHFAAFLAKERPEFVATEELIANLTVGYAGQFDFVARLRGKNAICDVKTGASGYKPTFRLQLAAYQDAEFIGKPDDATQYPMPSVDAGFVLLLRPDGYELVPATPTKADREHFRELAAAYHRARRWAEALKSVKTEEEAA